MRDSGHVVSSCKEHTEAFVCIILQMTSQVIVDAVSVYQIHHCTLSFHWLCHLENCSNVSCVFILSSFELLVAA